MPPPRADGGEAEKRGVESRPLGDGADDPLLAQAPRPIDDCMAPFSKAAKCRQ
jgi:hypothetical protein